MFTTTIMNWWLTWRQVAGHWQKLRPYFRPLVVRSFISWFAIAPIAIRVMRDLPPAIPIRFGTNEYNVELSLPFSWYLLWFASLAYFVAYVIYLSSSPRLIKEFPDFSEFVRQNHSPRFLAWELSRVWRTISDTTKIAKRLIDKKLAIKIDGQVPDDNPRVEARGTIFAFVHNGETYEVTVHEDDNQNRQRELFWEIFGPPAASAPVRRHTTWVLLMISFILVAIVVLQQIWFVLSYLFG